MVKTVVLVLVLSIAAGCAPRPVRVADQFAREGNWEGAVLVYQEALSKRPDDEKLRAKLDRAKLEAAKSQHARGTALLAQRAVAPAVEALKQAVAYDPNTEAYRETLAQALKVKEAAERYQAALQLLKTERHQDAIAEFERVLALDPAHAGALQGIRDAEDRLKLLAESDELTLTSDQPITLRFQNARLKEVFDLLSKTAGVNFLFDRDIRDEPVTIFVKNTTFRDALNLVLTTNNLFMKRVAADTVLILPKTKQKIDQYQDLMIRTFYLSSAKAKDVVNLLRTMLDTRRMFVNEDLNTIVMRDAPDKIRIAEKIIEANDRQVAEVMFEIEVLEVTNIDFFKAGWNLRSGSGDATASLGVTPNPIALDAVSDLTSADFLLTLPSVEVSLIKTDANSKTLANPKIRVVDNKTAKINIGNKIPILLSTTTTAAATTVVAGNQTTTTSTEFKDVGIKLEIKPNIRLNNDVTMDLKLDVTSLGEFDERVGQFRFGTRTTDTTINVRDGETVVIGGLISDENRAAANKLPWLGEIPVLGKLFGTTENEKRKIDVLLTITPRVIRGLSAPDVGVQSFWSGTEEGYSTQPLFTPSEAVSQPAASTGPGETVPLRSPATTPSAPAPPSPAAAPRPPTTQPQSRPNQPAVVFPATPVPAVPTPSTAN
ncbi:MAG: secretin N-terminal domain-containing protein [Nitrospirota bacterium]